ncbi:ATP-binding protein [Fervidicoccus fontis]|uniref:ATP-binding protein n=1 Tax=Fervidicoccus fontis TaxID=683846 RepID=A0A2J6N3R3_9CREN|nr:ATP-binding protein [Fervidicoccus fontis]MBE9390917.1 ATP-binding protein [Fervidicoccus fontis]PMB75997.1 MAG: ATP-binding protein [Fervidicoccus fontis]PMB77121.1 MAG: ATP-binding protein [Fervidicoccus fontis]HEW64428.1 ATP-binding protein [Fervidicoccus fontis]
MLFDPRPKVNKKDLYDFEKEFEFLKKNIGEPLLVVSGLRRTGKTSLILSTLNDSDIPYVFFDMRSMPNSRRDLYHLLSEGLTDFLTRISNKEKFYKSLTKMLKLIRGISVDGFEVSLSWGKDRASLVEILRALDESCAEHGIKAVIVFDELQRVTGKLSVELANAIAYSYDHLRNLSFIVSGSEMGVLYRFFDEPNAPLYGRAYLEVKTRRLDKEKSIDFLKRGFEESKIRVNDEELEAAVDKLDGIIGWLTYYGYSRTMQNRDFESIWREAVTMARQELENFLKNRVSAERYRAVLKFLANGEREWKELKKKMEDLEGRVLSERVLYDILITLRKYSIIDDQNNFLDPLAEEAAKNL